MSKKMLIDAAHAEETRVVVVDGTRVEEFDFESQTRKQLRGNIYLAKVTRVEPSLQAAFIEYGGNRHGFLAFNEIHPDYYQIPVADREALMRDDSGDDEDDTPISRRASGGDDEDDVNGGDHAVAPRHHAGGLLQLQKLCLVHVGGRLRRSVRLQKQTQFVEFVEPPAGDLHTLVWR